MVRGELEAYSLRISGEIARLSHLLAQKERERGALEARIRSLRNDISAHGHHPPVSQRAVHGWQLRAAARWNTRNERERANLREALLTELDRLAGLEHALAKLRQTLHRLEEHKRLVDEELARAAAARRAHSEEMESEDLAVPRPPET